MKNAKCTVDANEFRQALEKALKAAAKKSRIPFLLEALVTFEGGICTLTCTDLETWCQVSIPAQVEPCSFMLVNSGKLLTACKYFSGDLTFTYLEDQPPESAPQKTNLDGTLTLSCGNKELRQRVAAALDFPVMPEVKAEHTYFVDPAALSKRFERIKYALSDNEARPCSQCVKFFDNRIGAVDGYRMALNRDESLCVDDPFYIPPSGDVYERLILKTDIGPQIFKVYCRDNKAPNGIISRELVKETVREDTNEYKKLSNISFTKEGGIFSYDNLASDPHVDPLPYCLEAQRLFELYQRCIGRRQIETILENFVESMQAVKIARGHIYFIPRDYMAKLSLFEDFIELLEQHNQFQRPGRVPLDANSMFVVDDAKQREKMASAFYGTVRKEIAEYEDRATHLIQSGSQSPAILEKLVLRIRSLEEKRTYYEDILHRELTDLDDQFTSLRYLSDELQIRARILRGQKKAA